MSYHLACHSIFVFIYPKHFLNILTVTKALLPLTVLRELKGYPENIKQELKKKKNLSRQKQKVKEENIIVSIEVLPNI